MSSKNVLLRGKVFAFSLFLLCVPAQAEMTFPNLFGDNMVLQQKAKNTIWGWTEAGRRVTISSSWGAEASVIAGKDGKWSLLLETPVHGIGHSLEISDGVDKKLVKNVAIGEVWLCAGQSNMGWSLGQTFGGEQESAKADFPNYRIFKSSREHWHEPLNKSRDRLAKWLPCTPKSAAATSAVSYYFGRKLHQELGVPVGIIVQAYAGTPIEGWMPWQIQKDDARAQAHKKSLDDTVARQTTKLGMTHAKSLVDFNQELKTYNEKIDVGETMKNKFRQLSPPTITKPADLGNQYPAHIFNAMIYPVRPYGIRGMIWYQGERNAKNVPQALRYLQQLPQMIDYYRQSWFELSGGNTDENFPFYFTQLPSWNPAQKEPVEGEEASWAVSREMMRLVSEEHANTGMVVTIDTGDPVLLHPQNKQPVGIRHAYLALKRTYGKDLIDSGPRYQKYSAKGNRVTLEFDSTGGGLTAAREGKLDALAIAGADRQWHWADAEIKGNTVVLSAAAVAKPVAARYAWAMNPSQRNLLYNKEGLPASPFRTDDWPLFEPGKEVIEVFKPKKPKGYQAADWQRPEMTQ
ncbi:MAG: sialate O-acetylesterase [Verrucomicrobiota bacterium]